MKISVRAKSNSALSLCGGQENEHDYSPPAWTVIHLHSHRPRGAFLHPGRAALIEFGVWVKTPGWCLLQKAAGAKTIKVGRLSKDEGRKIPYTRWIPTEKIHLRRSNTILVTWKALKWMEDGEMAHELLIISCNDEPSNISLTSQFLPHPSIHVKHKPSWIVLQGK